MLELVQTVMKERNRRKLITIIKNKEITGLNGVCCDTLIVLKTE